MRKYEFDLQRHAGAGTQVNTSEGYANAYTGDVTAFSGSNTLAPEMKTYYDTELLENARAELFFAQFGRPQPLPAGSGKTVEWRKWNTLPKATEPLTEGVIPTGEKLGQTSINTSLTQHGLYVSISDRLELHAIDPVIIGAVEELGASAGWTEDTLVRNVLMEGTNVMYADVLDANGDYVSTPEYRYRLPNDAVNGYARLTPDMVNKAVTWLKKQKTPRIDGKYIAIIHPSVAYDLRSSRDWVDYHQYADATPIYTGEIGELHGVRFIESTEAKVWSDKPLWNKTRKMSVSSACSSSSAKTADVGTTGTRFFTVSGVNFGSNDTNKGYAASLVGRTISVEAGSGAAVPGKYLGRAVITGVAYTNNEIFIDRVIADMASGDVILPGGAGLESADAAEAVAVYATLFLGKDAYGIVGPEGGGLEMIIKTKDQAGGPLDQFSTAGYKFETAAQILYEERMLRVESTSSYSDADEEN